MKLIGNHLSPYTRRVAISLHVLGMPFEMENVMVSKDPERVADVSPLTRIPVLVLDDGEGLVESGAILDAIEQMAGHGRELVPAAGAERRRVMQAAAIAVGCMEKAQWSFYETRFHPPEKVHQPFMDHNDRQVMSGLAHLETLAPTDGASWMSGMPAMTQADISSAVAVSFIRAVRPNLAVDTIAPTLAAHTARCEALDAFRAAPLPAM